MPRQQRPQVILGGHRRQAGEHVPEASVWMVAVTLAGAEERVEYGGAVAGIGMPDEEPVRVLPYGGSGSRGVNWQDPVPI